MSSTPQLYQLESGVGAKALGGLRRGLRTVLRAREDAESNAPSSGRRPLVFGGGITSSAHC